MSEITAPASSSFLANRLTALLRIEAELENPSFNPVNFVKFIRKRASHMNKIAKRGGAAA